MLNCRHTTDDDAQDDLVGMSCPFVSSHHLHRYHPDAHSVESIRSHFRCVHVARMMELRLHHRTNLHLQHSHLPTVETTKKTNENQQALVISSHGKNKIAYANFSVHVTSVTHII